MAEGRKLLLITHFEVFKHQQIFKEKCFIIKTKINKLMNISYYYDSKIIVIMIALEKRFHLMKFFSI